MPKKTKNEEQIVLAPASIPQEQFLESESTITLYHGSAGGGKTFAIILLLYKYLVFEKNTTAVVFRQNSSQLRAGGGIWQEASTVFKRALGKRVIIRNKEMQIYVPETNSSVKFSHLQYQSDVTSHLGAQYSLILYDEATTFEPFEEFILPLIGRLRNANVNYPCKMYWATNPKFDHGIYHWIKDFYLDEEGIPSAEKSNVERYFVLQNNQPIWYNSLEDAEKIHGKGPTSGIRSFRAIRSHVTQNIPLMKKNPEYISNLMAMPDVKRRIYLDGSWTAREEEAGLFKREWVTFVNKPNFKAKKRVFAWDLASSPVSSASPNPDWTRGVLMSKDQYGVYTIEDLISIRDRPHIVEELIYNTAKQNPDVVFVLPIDPGQAGVAYANSIKKNLAEIGVECRLVKPTKAKRLRFLPFSSIAEAGFVHIVQDDWTETVLVELEEFTGLKKRERDDICDCVSDAVYVLNKTIDIPEFSLPDMTTSNPFSISYR